jgi:cell fate regulator YaaT (PSP1 superfamily)
VFDWLSNMELPGNQPQFDMVEIRFKNSRKEFFKNVNGLSLGVGDVVAVEASPGHDIGIVSATGELVRLQMKKKRVNEKSEEIKKIYRKAKQSDVDKWQEAQKLEVPTMYKARTFALHHGLQMKISDVEYQGDKTKAIFYYTADSRVDFRQLIKTLAEEFKVRVEMRQIGARQEAARLGAIGSCGRELCCSTWLSDFRSVSTSAARYQQLSLNPLKLAGQCGKLKCCLNYELDSYLDAIKDFPNTDHLKLKTKKGLAIHQKTDIFKRMMWFTYEGEFDNFIPLTVDVVKEIISMNKEGNLPDELKAHVVETAVVKEHLPEYENVVGQDSITRFDKSKKQGLGRNNRNRNKNKPQNKQQQGAQSNASGPKPVQQQQQNKPQNQQGPKPQQQGPKPQNQQGPKPQQQHNKQQGGNQQKPNPNPQGKPHGHQHRKRPPQNNRPNTNDKS